MMDQLDSNVLNTRQGCPYHNELLSHPVIQLQRSGPSVFYAPERNMWVVTRYEDVVKVLQDYDHFSGSNALSNFMTLTPEVREVLRPIMPICKEALIRLDPPVHTRVRSLVNKAFTPRRVALIEPYVHKMVSQALEAVVARGQIDLVEEFARRVPFDVLYALLGIPEHDRKQVCDWSVDWMSMITAHAPPERQLQCAHSMVAFANYMRNLVELRRAEPQDDLISAMIQSVEEGLAPLSQVELADTIYTLVLAGPETVAFTLSNGIYWLLSDRALWEQLCQQRELIPQCVEEMLRLAGTALTAIRVATAEIEIDGVTIPKGATVMAALRAASCSPEVFDDPDTFSLQRPNSARHLAFGQGAHFCLGASLARLELRVFLEHMTERLPSLRLVPNQTVPLLPRELLLAVEHLRVEWDERS